jgi:hypothetical protein
MPPIETGYRVSGKPPFVADRDSLDFDSGHSVNWALVPESYRKTPGQIVSINGAVAADVTPLTVDALEQAIPAGTLLYFGQLGETVRTTALAAAGATTIAVEADHTAIEDNDTAVINGSGPKTIPAGTRVGTLLSGDEQIVPRIAGTNPAIGILATDANEDSKTDSRSGYGVIVGGVIYENHLPGATGSPRTIAAGEKTELAAAGTGFSWKQYFDSSAS